MRLEHGKLERGTQLVCMRGHAELEEGKTYTFVGVSNPNLDDPLIEVLGVDGSWGLSRFELADKNAQPKSKATTSNPKDLFGAVKVSLTKLPPVALAHAAHAMMDGATKYGPYNWRDKDVIASIYVDAAMRHLLDWFEGQETAKDSGVHHLGHAMACCAILLDALENGCLIDDRPVFGDPDVLDRVFDRLSSHIKAKKEASA